MLRMYRDTFWVAISTAAPVIALAVVVAYNDMRRENALFMRQSYPLLGSLPVWRSISGSDQEMVKEEQRGRRWTVWRYLPPSDMRYLKPPKDKRRVRRWTWTTVGLHRLNVLVQATVLGFSLTSLAQQVNEIPLALAIAAEVGGLVALLGAGAAAERTMDALYEVLHREAHPAHPDPDGPYDLPIRPGYVRRPRPTWPPAGGDRNDTDVPPVPP